MSEHIYPKSIHGNLYYYYQRTYREKIDPTDSGKTRGSGRSRVKTESVYLGSAASILKRLKETQEPLETHHREFGFVAAVYQTIERIGLADLLREHIPGHRFGMPRWLFFLLPIVNRLGHATSKRQMGKWAEKTVLPQLLGFDPSRLSSKTFWYVTDEALSEEQLRKARKEKPEIDNDLFVGLDESVFDAIEEKLAVVLRERCALEPEALLYDTTNFFNYIETPTPSKLARTGHNKDSHHHLKQVGLAMCVDKEWGIPLFHRLYRGNCHDTKTFSQLVGDLIRQMTYTFDELEQLVLVLDKGNNTRENFRALHGKIAWVGSLVPSHFPDLLELPLTEYIGEYEKLKYFRLQREVMGVDCALVLTYNPTLARKQEHSLQRGIENLKNKIRQRWSKLKRAPKRVPASVISLQEADRYGKFLKVRCRRGQPHFETVEKEIEKRRGRIGKQILFSDQLGAESEWIIRQYKSKEMIEDGFKLLKSPDLIRFRPCRHWTDTKIRAFGFCCVMALVVIRVMLRKAELADLRMSANVLKEELSDLKQVIMIYSDKKVRTQISRRGTVQQRLWELFELEAVERDLTIH